jgi:Domain of unknown function (DUF4383)
MAKTFAMVLGVVMLLLGILGYVLNPTGGLLLGVFAVNDAHNVIHLVTGIAGLAAAFMGWARLFCQLFGVVYLLVAVLGFVATDSSGMLLGMVHNNMADNLLHLIIGGTAAYIGFVANRARVAAKV